MADRIALVSVTDPVLLGSLTQRLAADGIVVTSQPGEELDVLVRAVDLPPPRPFVGVGSGGWYDDVMAELTPAFQAVRNAVPALRRSRAGRIVLIGAGWLPADRPGVTAAAAVHGALVALVKTLARDLGPDGITVNEVVVDPDGPADPAAVAAAVSYLCRPEAGAMVGQLLTVGRGGSLRP
jgi:NAD(P)-dependent dehydrogenase (short-subunit alcohol dehydrogenase family)